MLSEFRQLFGSTDGVRAFRAPGRVNLIGEHTDYNLGFVLPAALDLATYIAAAPASDGRLRIHSEDRRETQEFEVATLADIKPRKQWTDYPIGVAQQLLRAGYSIEPTNLLIRSTVPEGGGLSSSAALEVSTALALLRGRGIGRLELARLCQRAEREFVGMPCGIMDQYISVFGREGFGVRIDCRSLDHTDIRLPDGITFIATNTMVKHALAGSAYQDRVRECAEAAAAFGVPSLRDVTPQQFAASGDKLPEIPRKRARHIIFENERVGRFVEAASKGAVEEMGAIFYESHESLRMDYEVSCDELDYLVETARGIPGVLGSRMTGGGFGGCTVTMLRPDAVPAYRKEITARYSAKFGREAQFYPCRPSAGAGELNNFETIPPAVALIDK